MGRSGGGDGVGMGRGQDTQSRPSSDFTDLPASSSPALGMWAVSDYRPSMDSDSRTRFPGGSAEEGANRGIVEDGRAHPSHMSPAEPICLQARGLCTNKLR